MYFVDNGSAVPVMPQVKPVSSATPQFFTEGGNGTPPTYPGPDWFNIFQSELLNILAEAGLNPDKADNKQLAAAMRKLFMSRANPGADIKTDGTVAMFLANVGLGGIASPADITAGTVQKLIDAAGLKSFLPKRAFAANDYIRIPDVPGGLIIQWGSVTSTGTNNAPFSFPIAFPNACLEMAAIGYGSVANNFHLVNLGSNPTTTGFTMSFFLGSSGSAPSVAGATAVAAKYIAVGY